MFKTEHSHNLIRFKPNEWQFLTFENQTYLQCQRKKRKDCGRTKIEYKIRYFFNFTNNDFSNSSMSLAETQCTGF